MIKKIFLLLVAVLSIAIIINFNIIVYGLHQLKGQLNIVMAAKPIKEVLADASTPDSIRYKLKLIEEIKQFAEDSLSLNHTENYTSVYNQHGKPVLWVLTAASPFSMKNYEWDYPFLGNLSYKGFFDKERGITEKQWLAAKGFDTDLSPTGGWSTLGWFNDPILSNMLKRNEGSLADLIIHELTHATLYISGNTSFNENLATFIGEKGAEKFITVRFKNDSVLMNKYLQRRHDDKLYAAYMLQAIDTLQNLYKSFHGVNMTSSDKYLIKYRKIAQLMNRVSELPLYNKEKYEWDFSSKKLPDNTWFLSYSNYRKSQEEMDKFFKDSANGDIKTFITYYKLRYAR